MITLRYAITRSSTQMTVSGKPVLSTARDQIPVAGTPLDLRLVWPRPTATHNTKSYIFPPFSSMICPYLLTSRMEPFVTAKAPQNTTARDTCVWRRTLGKSSPCSNSWNFSWNWRVARADKPDLNLSMNADPKEEKEVPELLGQYFSLDADLKPIGVSYSDNDPC